MKDMETLAWFLNGAMDEETPASRDEAERLARENEGKPSKQHRHVPPGFARGSAAWETAVSLALPLVELSERPLDNKPVALDLFAPPPVEIAPRYELAAEWWDAMPHTYGGDRVEDAAGDDDADENSYALAWDAETVIHSCPRGHACTMSREKWDAGYRYCEGC